ncbi:MAG TPA: efflux RND transporter permease subunit [Thermoanaerobaculia bacterium]|nr:efflux RND transporter permease subunit [Thermoanaerobaculia bacterium]
MSLPKLAVHRPVTTAMLLVSVLVLGAIAVVRLPQAFLPEVDAPFIGIEVPSPSSNPTQVEKEIVKPVEEVLATLPSIGRIYSTAGADGAFFELEFDWGQEIDLVRMQVSEKMQQIEAELPPDAGPVRIFSFSTADIPVIQGRLSATGVDLSESYELIESRIVNRLRRVPGVARVDLGGVAPKEIAIDLVLARVIEHGVDVGELIERLRGATATLVLGEVRDGALRTTARGLGAFDSIEALAELPLDERGLRLGDVAEISYEEPPLEYGRHLDGDFAVALEIFKESTANTVDVVQAATAVIENEIGNDPLLEGVRLFVWEDQAEAITNGIDGLTRSGFAGSLMALVVLWFFLRRLDSTLIVSASIPFSILAACAVLYFLGKNLNILSMMGLILGVGMLVDNAVVVLESIDRKHRTVVDPRRAALDGAREVWVAVAASTLTSLIVFLPLIVGGKSELTTWLGEVGIAISIALACSLLSSLTLIPLASAHLLREKKTRPSRVLSWLEDRYQRLLGWTLRHRGWTAAGLVASLALGVVPFAAGLVDAAVFSGTVNSRLYLGYDFQDFAYKSKAREAVLEVERFLDGRREEYGIESVYSYFAENEASTVLTLLREDLDDDAFGQLRDRIRDELPTLPGVRLYFDEDAESGGSTTYFAVKLYGQDSQVLGRLAAEAARLLETVDGVEDARTERSPQREVRVTVDRAKALKAGLSPQDVAEVFTFTLGGLRLDRFNAGGREVETWLALRLEDRESVADLAELQVGGGADGRPVRLGDVARFEIVPKPREIRREDRKVRTAIDATYEGDDFEAAKAEIGALMDALDLPAGTTWGWNDRILEQEDQGQQMAINFLLALLLVYIVMASLFESLAQPFAILASIFFALPGAAWMLVATGTSFNLMAQIGLLILMGIVVNNGIVLLDHVNRLRAEGLPRDQAILAAGRDRLRPILMTATTTIIGLVPLALRGATVGGIFYYPLARTVMGGLISASVLTLVFLPTVSNGMEGLAGWLRGVWRASGQRRRETVQRLPVAEAAETIAS